MKRIVVVGAGPSGCMAALLLDARGYHVTLLERHSDILLGGASAAANVNHSDGFEYYKPGHRETGESCVDGAIAKSLLLPVASYDSGLCSVTRPARFMVSNESNGKDGLTRTAFSRNAEHMRQRFRKHFKQLLKSLDIDSKDLGGILRRDPITFAHVLDQDELSDCDNIAFGYAGSGCGIDMGSYYAIIRTCIEQSRIELKTGQNITSIKRTGNSGYVLNFETHDIYCDLLLLTCAHSITDIIQILVKENLCTQEPTPGTYFLNAMTYVSLPATQSSSRIDSASRINFTLQGEGGAMFACITPPSATSDGYGAIYFPSPKGSQIHRCLFYPGDSTALDKEWRPSIRNGLSIESPRIKAITRQAERFYPFLRDYAKVEKVVCRSVFNPSTTSSNQGLERRVREIIGADVLSLDGKIAAFRSPKWTTAELVGMITADYAFKVLGDTTLPKSAKNGLGPTSIDLAKISSFLDIRKTKINGDYREHYQRQWRVATPPPISQ